MFSILLGGELVRVLKIPLVLFLIMLITGCVKTVPLDNAQAEQIKSTKLIVVKQQNTLELPPYYPSIVFSPDPFTMIIGTIVVSSLGKFVLEPREQAAFAPVKKDLETFNFEKELSKHLNNMVAQNKHFKFTSLEVVTINSKMELPKIIESASTEHVALLLPTYTLNNNMNLIFIEVKLSVYKKPEKFEHESSLPEPIYQTSIEYKYKLPKAAWFSHVDNAKRWSEDNSNLMVETLNNGASIVSGNLMAKLDQPFSK